MPKVVKKQQAEPVINGAKGKVEKKFVLLFFL